MLRLCVTVANWHIATDVVLQAIGVVPDQSTVRALQRIAWSSCAAGLQLVHAPYDQIHQAVDQLHGCVIGGEGDRLVPDADDVAVCREALEVLSICLALSPEAVDVLYKERVWQTFIIDVLLVCRNRLLTVKSTCCGLCFTLALFLQNYHRLRWKDRIFYKLDALNVVHGRTVDVETVK